MEARFGMIFMLSSLALYSDAALDEQNQVATEFAIEVLSASEECNMLDSTLPESSQNSIEQKLAVENTDSTETLSSLTTTLPENNQEVMQPPPVMNLEHPITEKIVFSAHPSEDTSSQITVDNASANREFSEQVQIGGNYSYAWITPRNNSTTHGSLGGIRAIYEHRPHDSIYAALALSWRAGMTRHHDDVQRKIQDYNGQERIGYTFGKKRISNDRLTLFTGFGVRYLAEKASTGSASLALDYTEFYVPLGFLFDSKVNSFFTWGCNFQWMPQVFPMVRLKPLDGAQWNLTHQISNFFVEIPFTLSVMTDRLVVIIAPFLESWHDGHSTAKTTTGLALDLPSNYYLFTGLNISLSAAF